MTLLSGCPDGGGGGGGGGGTGTGTGGTTAEPLPPDGEGIGEVAAPGALGRAPRTIGMGAPYDARPMTGTDPTTTVPRPIDKWARALSLGEDTSPGARYGELRKLGLYLLQPVVRGANLTPDAGGLSLTFEDDGLYLYRNWVMAAGNIGGLAALVAHNLAYDVTFAWVGDLKGSPLGLFGAQDLVGLESTYPCVDDPQTPRDECGSF